MLPTFEDLPPDRQPAGSVSVYPLLYPYRVPHRPVCCRGGSYPHHKHVSPDIKRHRVPAPELSFTRPNLPALIEEVERLLKK